MINIPLLLSFLAFAGILLLVIGIYSYINYSREHNTLIEKIKKNESAHVWEESSKSPESDKTLKQISDKIIKRYFLKVIAMAGNLSKPKSKKELSHLQKIFLRAGYRSNKSMTIYFGVKVILTILLPTAFYSLRFFIPNIKLLHPSYLLMILFVLASIGFYSPTLWIRAKIARRKDKIFKGFPDMLDMLVVCVEAGVGLNAAIYRISEELKFSYREISEELQILNWELKAGKSRREALKNLAVRVDLEDVKSLVTLLIQTEKFGTSVAKALRVYSDTMRTRRFQRAEEMAAKIALKLLFPLIFFIFPSLFIAILGPAIIQVMRLRGG
ncbi:MAG: type II secretion system F family protein [bacterium]